MSASEAAIRASLIYEEDRQSRDAVNLRGQGPAHRGVVKAMARRAGWVVTVPLMQAGVDYSSAGSPGQHEPAGSMLFAYHHVVVRSREH